MDKRKRDGEDGSSPRHPVGPLRVGRPWNGELDVGVRRFTLLTHISWVLLALLGALALQMLLARDSGLARQLLSLVRDLLLIIVGALIRPSPGGR